ncbi:unnamed protein product [Candida verbasci]|uniref:Helicase SWR1 n=1 Tax=Candida verbasci TaxID=1227364 RepID=A0A9W4TX96_9ASCO|nr:unnamed protein product [Candida verbasci]
MPNNGHGRRTSRRLTQNGSSSINYNENSTINTNANQSNPPKRTNTSTSKGSSKRRKIVAEPTKEEKLSRIMTDFNLAINELFQLNHYKTIVPWEPSQFSSIQQHLPEPFINFKESNNNLELKWDNELQDDNELSNLPLRFQKKRLAEIEQQLEEKYPFRAEVIEKAKELEREIINSLNDDVRYVQHQNIPKKTPITQPKKGRPGRPPKKKVEELPDSDIEEVIPLDEEFQEELENHQALEDSDDDEEEESTTTQFNPRIKSIKHTIPTPIVTHPSHLPTWRIQPPERLNLGSRIVDISGDVNNDEDNISKFDPTPLTIIQNKEEIIIAPELAHKLSQFLESNCKTPIIDEGNVPPEYNFTKEEYDTILQQQSDMFKQIQHKIEVENCIELVNDHIERRKIVLPQLNTKLTDPFRSTSSTHPKIQGVANNLTFQDHLISQGVNFAKIHQQMRKQHQFKTKKIATMIESHFKKKAGEKERAIKEREQNLKKVSRLAIQAVKKRWNQAFKVYQIIQNEKDEELKKEKGREHLSQMLEHSTQLLEAQLTSREGTEDIESEIQTENESQFGSGSDSENFSSSESEIEEKNEENDEKLSIEQLKLKYANLESSVEPIEEKEGEKVAEDNEYEVETENEVNQNGNGSLSPLYDGVLNLPNSKLSDFSSEYTEEQKSLIEKLNEDSDTAKNSLLNSDESESMTDSESESEEEEEDNSEEDVKPNGKSNGGLANLFSTQVDDEDADFDMEEEEEEEDDEDEDESGSDMDIDNEEKKVPVSETDDESNVEIINGSKVRDVPIPSLLRGTLRPYQKQGLNWLASLYNNNTNGILADEMGLGKTIQTISVLAYLACEKLIWGPHLIIVPTSVMLNWEMEFKKFAPGFKVLTYYGSPQQRAQKRKGWNKSDSFHVCITSYQLVVQDQQSFKRRKWRYMILDEAHNIKNFRSTRWRALLNFNTENRLLLTGTPLQNNLMELWSLLYFLMPSSKVNQAMPEGFANLDDFQQWFGKPVDKILEQTTLGTNSDLIDENEKTTSRMDQETKNTVARLHQVLRPYLLRRLKKDVEQQMPGKFEHIVYCRLSKRQRYLYDDFMSRAKTKETLASGNFLSIINCLMQLRKVCNHPDLFEVRPIVTSFALPKSAISYYQGTNEIIKKLTNCYNEVNFNVLNLDITNCESMNYFISQSTNNLKSSKDLQSQIDQFDKLSQGLTKNDLTDYVTYYQHLKLEEHVEIKEKLKQKLYLNNLRCERRPIFGNSLLTKLKLPQNAKLDKFIMTIPDRVNSMSDEIEKYSIITPSVVALDMKDQIIPIQTQRKIRTEVAQNTITNPFHKSQVKLSIAFPDKSLLQYDCGKLQKLATLLQKLTSEGHRALIFTQMTKVLDILEQFLNIHGYRYMRLDGSTKIEDRQLLTEQFNRDNKIPVFILSTRSGGLGINLTGADTVIFYDSDWNPAMDKQCQDRCHRIGQVRDVHIYRFVSEFTIESNIIKKANQKRQLDNVVIQEGEFTTDYFGKFSVKDLVSDENVNVETDRFIDFSGDAKMSKVFAQAEDEEDRKAAGNAMKEVQQIDVEDFNEEGGDKPSEIKKSVLDDDDENADADFDEGIGHIDEYMLRFISDGYYYN